jgi:hypothetical protein
MKGVKKSMWFLWGFVPYLNFAAWIHAAVRTGRSSYCWYAAVYAVPFSICIMDGAMEGAAGDLGISKQMTEIGRSITAVASVAACLLWIVGIIHILSKKHSVDQEIQAHDEGRMQGGRVVASSPPLPSVQGSASRGEKAPGVGEPGVTNAQVVALGSPPLSSAVRGTGPAEPAPKTFRYVDGQGNVVGPATLGSLRALRQAGIVCDTTQIIDEEARRSLPLGQLLGVRPDAAQPRL